MDACVHRPEKIKSLIGEAVNASRIKILANAILPFYFEMVYTRPDSPINSIEDIAKMIKEGYYIFPLAALVYMIAVLLWSPVTSALITLLITLIISYVMRSTWMTPKKIFKALVNGIDEAVPIIVIAAVAGMIAGSVTYSGLTLRFS